MELRLYESLFNAAAAAIESARPEVFGVYTKGYQDLIKPPWSYNKPSNTIQLSPNDARVDFDARGSGIHFNLSPGDISISLLLDASLMRSIASLKEPIVFRETVETGGSFARQKKDNAGYSLILYRLILQSLQSAGPRLLLSWLLSSALTQSISRFGVPTRVELLKNALAIKLDKPTIEKGCLRINAKLET